MLNRRSCNKVILAISLSFVLIGSTDIFAQNYKNVINGYVYDADSGLRLPAVNVYLSNTTLGDASDTLGAYQISNIPPGNYDLVYHFVGYEQLVKNIDIGIEDTLTLDAGLNYTAYELDSLVVVDERDRLWKRNLNRFIRHFIGRSNNAKQTKIMNAEVLDFKIESFGTYTATAQRELHIVNEALGYESFVRLELFKWDYFNDVGQAFYFVRMKELIPENDAQMKEWEIRRSVTYDNSIRKFFKGLLYMVANQPEMERNYQNGLFTLTDIVYEDDNYKLFNGDIQKIEKEDEFEQYQPEAGQYDISVFKFNIYSGYNPLMVIPGDGEVSNLDYQNKDAEEYFIVIDQFGHLLNPLDIALGGYWSKFRFADFLPLNYRDRKN